MYYVYKTTNTVNNKIYVGVHKSDNIQSDQYLGSGAVLRQSISKYGKQKFIREILYQFETEKEAYYMQGHIVDRQFIKRKDTYNLKLGGQGGMGGLVAVKDSFGKPLLVSKDDPRYLSGQLVGVNKGNKMPKNHAVGNKNSQYGTIWINNGLVNKKILKCNEIPQGWFRGRINCQVGQKNSQYDTIWITTGFQNKKIKSHQTIPDGWRRGLVKLWKK